MAWSCEASSTIVCSGSGQRRQKHPRVAASCRRPSNGRGSRNSQYERAQDTQPFNTITENEFTVHYDSYSRKIMKQNTGSAWPGAEAFGEGPFSLVMNNFGQYEIKIYNIINWTGIAPGRSQERQHEDTGTTDEGQSNSA